MSLKELKNKAEKVLTRTSKCYILFLQQQSTHNTRKDKEMNEINVINNVPGISVTVNKNEDGSFAIMLVEKQKGKQLGSFARGSVVKIGNREYIVLDHSLETTAVIAKDFVKQMEFGSDGNWLTSKVRTYLNSTFYDELCKAVGKENIITHTVNLEADDGTGKRVKSQDKVSLLTTEQYRRYREYLPAYGKWWWLATRVSHDVKDYARNVCRVSSNGVLNWYCCDYENGGVRPFCILNSSVLVSE